MFVNSLGMVKLLNPKGIGLSHSNSFTLEIEYVTDIFFMYVENFTKLSTTESATTMLICLLFLISFICPCKDSSKALCLTTLQKLGVNSSPLIKNCLLFNGSGFFIGAKVNSFVR